MPLHVMSSMWSSEPMCGRAPSNGNLPHQERDGVERTFDGLLVKAGEKLQNAYAKG